MLPIGQAKTTGLRIAAGYNFMPVKDRDLNGAHHAFVNAGVSIPLR
jgi:hypothetical protein